MFNKDNKHFLLLISFAVIVGLSIVVFFLYDYEVKRAEKNLQIENEKLEQQRVILPSQDIMLENHILGKKTAKIKLYIINSLSSPYSADFYKNLFAIINANYIESGKVKAVFYDFIVDKSSIYATMLGRCIEDVNTYINLTSSLYANQEKWAMSNNVAEALSGYGKLAGLNQASIEACFSNTELRNKIIEQNNKIKTKYNINSVPSFVLVKGRKYRVVRNYRELENAIKLFK